jgi:hypothetical protein
VTVGSPTKARLIVTGSCEEGVSSNRPHRGVSRPTERATGPIVPPANPAQKLRRLTENLIPDCAGFSFVFKARQQAYSCSDL